MSMKTRPFLVALAASLSACASASMDVPPELTAVERLSVEGRGGWRGSRRAAFGPWEATGVERSWTGGSGWRIAVGPIGGGSQKSAQEYTFLFLEEGSEVGRVDCAAVGVRRTGARRILDVDLSAREALECRQDGEAAEEEPVWDLVVDATSDGHLEGFLRIAEARYALSSAGTGGKLLPTVIHGFEFRDPANRVVAAVETVNEGSVILSPELTGPVRTAFAAAAAALLLYERVEAD